MSAGAGGPVVILGAGRVGGSLGLALSAAGVELLGIWSRAREGRAPARFDGVPQLVGALPDLRGHPAVVVAAVRDEALPGVAAELLPVTGEDTVVLHCSGATPAAQALAPLARRGRDCGTFHPLVAVPDARRGPARLRSACFTLEGAARAVTVGRRLAAAIGASTIELQAAQLGLYHAAAVIASNHVVALCDVARKLLQRLSVPEALATAALVPLLRSTVENIAEVGLPEALTGPLRRGDVGTVALHLRELALAEGEWLAAYRAVARLALQSARACAVPPDAADLARIGQLLEE